MTTRTRLWLHAAFSTALAVFSLVAAGVGLPAVAWVPWAVPLSLANWLAYRRAARRLGGERP